MQNVNNSVKLIGDYLMSFEKALDNLSIVCKEHKSGTLCQSAKRSKRILNLKQY